MFIIVAGAGLFGQELIRKLVGREHDVVVIDIAVEACEKVYAETGATAINGSATDIDILREANAQKADTIICLMRNDSDNIASALLAQSLGTKRVLVRMRNPVYEQAYRKAGVDSILSVAELLLHEFINEVEQPQARMIMELNPGRAAIYAINIEGEARSIGIAISDITKESGFPRDVVFMGIFRKKSDDFLIPRGTNIIQSQDVIFLAATHKSIDKAAEHLTNPIGK